MKAEKFKPHSSHTITNLMCTTCALCSCKQHILKDKALLECSCRGRKPAKKYMPIGYTPK